MKQGAVLVPTLFGIFFSLVLTFRQSEYGVLLGFSTPGVMALFSTSPASELRRECAECSFVSCSSQTMPLSLSIRRSPTVPRDPLCSGTFRVCPKHQPEKSNILTQDISTTPAISIGDHTLDEVEKFTDLGSNISNNLSLDAELNVRIAKAATAMARLPKTVWDNTILTLNTKVRLYQACVSSTLLHGIETGPLCSHQERRLNA